MTTPAVTTPAVTTPHDKLRRLAGRVPARCVWVDLPSATAAEIVGQAGPELAVIDTEHGQIGPETLADMIRALELTGTPALVRVGDAGAGRVKHALDAGAAGLVVPYVETAAEARAAVRAFCAPPLGARGMATGVTRAARYGAEADYAKAWNDRGLLALQIESEKGLAVAPEIAAVEGVDMLFLGPSDYAADRGFVPAEDSEAVLAALREMADAARSAGKLTGAFPWPGADPARLVAEGIDLVAASSDVRALMGALTAALGACPLPEA